MKEFKFIISGGGTGGHIYPAISISNELKLRYPIQKYYLLGQATEWKCKLCLSMVLKLLDYGFQDLVEIFLLKI